MPASSSVRTPGATRAPPTKAATTGDRPSLRRGSDGARHARRVGGRLRGQEHEHRVRAVGAERVQRVAVAARVGIAHQVHRVGEPGHRRQSLGEPLAQRLGGRLHGEAGRARRVGGDDAEPTPVGHHHQATAARGRGSAGEPARDVEQLGDGLDAERARLPGRRVERAVGPRERAGVRGHRTRALGGAARLQQHHRVDRGGAAECVEEPGAVGHPLDVPGDHPGLRIGGPRVEEIALVDVGLVPERGEES